MPRLLAFLTAFWKQNIFFLKTSDIWLLIIIPRIPDCSNTLFTIIGNYRVRKTLESWHTAKTVRADIILNRYQDNILSYCNLILFYCPFFSFPHFYCIFLVLNFFSPSPEYIKGYSIIAESSYFKTFLTRERFLPFLLCQKIVRKFA